MSCGGTHPVGTTMTLLLLLVRQSLPANHSAMLSRCRKRNMSTIADKTITSMSYGGILQDGTITI